MSRVQQLTDLYSIASQEGANYYDVLGLAKDCNDKDIKKAYRKLSMICHPDNFVSESQEIQTLADNCSHLINKMYATLSDELKRGYYDDHGEELDAKDFELAKKERQSKEFINAIFSKLTKHQKCQDGAVKQTIHPKLVYHGGKHTFEYDGKQLSLEIPKGTLPMSAFTLKNVLGGDDVPEHLKGDLTVMCVYGNSKGTKIDKLDVIVNIGESDIKCDEKGIPTKVKVLGNWVDSSKHTIATNKEGTKFKIEGLGLQSPLFSAKGNLIIELTK